MGKGLLIMFVLGTLCVSACGDVHKKDSKSVPVKQEKIVFNETKVETIAKLQELRKLSEENYMVADANTRMVELRGREMAQLKKYRIQVEQEAEEYIAAQKKRLEEEYQLRMFNLRMQLDSLKMRSKNREQLENEIEDLRLERETKLAILEERKQNYVNLKIKVYKQAMQERLDAEAAKLP